MNRILKMGKRVAWLGLAALLAVLPAAPALADRLGTIIGSGVTPGTSTLTFASAWEDEIAGGYKVVDDIPGRNAITPERRVVGMPCYVISENKTYRLVGGILDTHWVADSADGMLTTLGLTMNSIPSLSSGYTLGDSGMYAVSGRIGIGTTAPNATLSTMAIAGATTIANFGVAGSSSVVIDGNGNVGIGTSIPGYKLEVNGTSFFANTVNVQASKYVIFGNSGPGGTAGGFEWLMTNDGASMTVSEVTVDQTDYVFKLWDNNTTDRFVWWIDEFRGPAYDKYPLVMSGQYADFFSGKVYIAESSGYVGIGSTAPISKLQVDGAIYAGLTLPSHPEVSSGLSGNAMFGRNVEIDGALYVDSSIYMTGSIYGDGSKLTNINAGTMITQNDTTVAIADGTATPIKFSIDGSTKMVLDANGNVGIGNAVPGAYKLNVNGDTSLTGTLYTSGSTGFGVAPQAFAGLSVNKTTTVNNTIQVATWMRLIGNPSALATTAVYRGMENEVFSQGAQHIGALQGGFSDAEHQGTGLLDEADGLYNVVKNTSSGVITYTNGAIGMVANMSTGHIDYATGFYAQILNQGAGYIDQAYGFEVGTPGITAGTINANYGLYIHPQTGAALNYAIYSEGGQHYFAGNVGIGSTVPLSKLQVDGAIYAGTTAPSHPAQVNLANTGNAMFGGNVEIDGAVYVDSGIYMTGAIYGDGSHLTGVTPAIQAKSFTVESPADTDNILLFKAVSNMTVSHINCIVDPADSGESAVIDVQQRDSFGDTPISMDTTIICGNGGAADDGALSNASVASGKWVSLDIGVVVGPVSQLSVTITY